MKPSRIFCIPVSCKLVSSLIDGQVHQLNRMVGSADCLMLTCPCNKADSSLLRSSLLNLGSWFSAKDVDQAANPGYAPPTQGATHRNMNQSTLMRMDHKNHKLHVRLQDFIQRWVSHLGESSRKANINFMPCFVHGKTPFRSSTSSRAFPLQKSQFSVA